MNCEKDDLAFIKKSLRPTNIGLVVECKEYLGYYLQDDIIEISGERWTALVSDNYWKVISESGSIDTMYGKSKVAYIPDLWLTPIKADKLGEDTDTSLTLDDEITT